MSKEVVYFPLIVLFTLVIFASCQKEGDEGPAGPAGPAGSQGPKGDTGVANVIYSEWLDVEFEAQVPTLAIRRVTKLLLMHQE